MHPKNFPLLIPGGRQYLLHFQRGMQLPHPIPFPLFQFRVKSLRRSLDQSPQLQHCAAGNFQSFHIISIGKQCLTVNEVESAFYEFSGTEVYSVDKWIVDFDEMVDSIGLTDWRRERDKAVRALYFLVMREIGAKTNLDADAIITHTVNGVNDNGPDKTLLYGVKSMGEFREKLRIYQGLKDSKYCRDANENHHNSTAEAQFFKPMTNRLNKSRSVICYRCGIDGIAKECSKKPS